jgi:putative intracellular protease/amidase
MVKTVVIVCTSAGELQGHPTGLWLEELATPYYLFLEQGYTIVVASPAGGAVPIDKNSLGDGFFTNAAKQFLHDAEAINHLSHTVILSSIDFTSGLVDALYLTGGHGTCVDFVNNPILQTAIESMYAAGHVVAADCHGPIGLAECNKADGTPLVAGLVVTGFSDTEEDAVQLTSVVPFLIETRFKELGAKYEKSNDWNPKVCIDGMLVTGQNPQSSEDCAKAVISLLGKS